jgi:hypothetical protein
MILAGLIYFGISLSAGSPWKAAHGPYFNYLADAFLHGQLNLRLMPATTQDLSFFQGKYYMYWGLLPAIFAIPGVAIWGVGINDLAQSLTFGALNVGLFALLMRKAREIGLVKLTPVYQALFVMFFALGTSYTPLPPVGNVWYLSQIEAITFSLLAFTAAFSFRGRKAFFWTGCALAGVFLTRMTAGLIAIFLIWFLLNRYWNVGLKRLFWLCIIGLIPVLIAVGIQAEYNFLRFGSLLETGISYHLPNPVFVENFSKYGIENIHYLPANIYYQLLFYPFYYILRDGYVAGWSGSLFLLSPVFFAAFNALWHDRKEIIIWALFASILIGSIPVFLILAPGSYQFGPRYTLDFTVPLLLLTAFGIRRLPSWLYFLLVGISVFQYLIGALFVVHAVY